MNGRGVTAMGVSVVIAVVAACSDDPAPPAPTSTTDSSDGGGGKVDGDGSSSPAAPVDGVEALAVANCAFQERCREGYFRPYFANQEQCVAAARFNFNFLAKAPGGKVIDAQMAKCAEKIAVGTCETAFSDVPECVFRGDLGDGAPCNASRACASGFCKFPAADAGVPPPTCGTCAKGAGEGESCLGINCQTDLVNEPVYNSTGTLVACTCKKAPGEGEKCRAGLFCRGLLQCVNEKCTKPLQKGEPCDPAADACIRDRDLVCTSGVCAAYVRGEPGATCDGTTTFCHAAECISGSCKSQGAAKEPCGEGFASCRRELTCSLSLTGATGNTGTCDERPAPKGCE